MVLTCVELEIAPDERSKPARLPKPKRLFVILDPSVELRGDQIEISWDGAFLAFATALCMLAAQPARDGLRVCFLAEALQFADLPFPYVARLLSRLGILNVRKKVALEHLGRVQGQPAVVHGFEDRVGILVGVGGNLHEVDVFDKPIREVRQSWL